MWELKADRERLNALLVPDVGVDPVEEAEGAFSGRYLKAGLGH